jgi:hypothetical protein
MALSSDVRGKIVDATERIMGKVKEYVCEGHAAGILDERERCLEILRRHFVSPDCPDWRMPKWLKNAIEEIERGDV